MSLAQTNTCSKKKTKTIVSTFSDDGEMNDIKLSKVYLRFMTDS